MKKKRKATPAQKQAAKPKQRSMRDYVTTRVMKAY